MSPSTICKIQTYCSSFLYTPGFGVVSNYFRMGLSHLAAIASLHLQAKCKVNAEPSSLELCWAAAFTRHRNFLFAMAKVLLFSPYSKVFALWQLAKIMLGSPAGGFPVPQCRVHPALVPTSLVLLILRRISNHSPNPSPIFGKGLTFWILENQNPSYVLAGRDFGLYCLMGASPQTPCSRAVALIKTFRTRRSLEECKFFESILSLRLRNGNLRNEMRNAVWAKRVHWAIWRICVPASELRTFFLGLQPAVSSIHKNSFFICQTFYYSSTKVHTILHSSK